VTCVMWNLTSFYLETVLVSVQERCLVFAKHTVRSKIDLDAPDGTPRYEAQMKAQSIWR
jgi:hypothetical protein